MAKVKHNNLLDTIDEIITDGKKKGVLHLYAEDENLTGRQLKIKGKDLYHFGTTSYLGLDQDIRLKEAAIEAIIKYGTQFPLSKTYISFKIYKDLEEKIFQMYQNDVIITKNSTLGHIAVIPNIIRDEDAVILDHQVHWTVQNACQLLKPRGISVDIIRHSNIDMLEEKIKELKNKSNKIWYMIDGVYSMFGDYAPINDIIPLLTKYPQFHLYIDDVHGMSWAGKHGTGWFYSQIDKLHEKMILVGTLSKSFGASGSFTVFGDKELYRKVKTFGGPLTFSAQLEPSSVAAALRSAEIHLSEEIYEIQNELREKINYCNSLIRQTDLPLVKENECPVFFIGTGIPAVGYNYADRIMKEGFYVNLGIFPAVPVKNTGIRFTISRHNQKEEIKGLVDAMAYHYPKALEDENKTVNQVRKAFNLPLVEVESQQIHNLAEKKSLNLIHKKTISELSRIEWDTVMADKGTFDYEGMFFLEGTFSNNIYKENNWDFDYYLIKDIDNNIVVSSFVTTSLWKDDLLAPAIVSKKIEEKRKIDPYYLTSIVVSVGSTFTEGEHLYIDKNHKEWKPALRLLLDKLVEKEEAVNASMIVLRDFVDDDLELKEFLIDQGFVKIAMPESCEITNMEWNNIEEYIQSLSYKSRKHFRQDVLKYEKYFDVEVKKELRDDELKIFSKLFDNVKSVNYDINTFSFPEKIFSKMSEYKGWEFLVLKLKAEYDQRDISEPIAVMFSYMTSNQCYCIAFIGMDYEFLEQYQLYRQTLYQSIKRAKDIGAKKVYLGFSASFEKKKLGARIIHKVAYVQAKDNFNMELIGLISAEKM